MKIKFKNQIVTKPTLRKIVFLILLMAMIGVIVGVVVYKQGIRSRTLKTTIRASISSPLTSFKKVCNFTPYPVSCYSSISSYIYHQNYSTNAYNDPKTFFNLTLRVARNAISKSLSLYPSMFNVELATKDLKLNSALQTCWMLLDDALDYVIDTISSMEDEIYQNGFMSQSIIDDMRAWLSASIIDQETCFDVLQELEVNSFAIEKMNILTQQVKIFERNCLSILNKVLSSSNSKSKIMSESEGGELKYPNWVPHSDRNLFQKFNHTPNVIVAKDGSGDVKTINEAIYLAPDKNISRFFIYVKEGVYFENVTIPKKKWNIMMYGDGKTKTIVTAGLNRVDNPGISTFQTATFAAEGKGFIGKNMKFINTADPRKSQAVAFRSKSHQSVLYNCSFEGFQDTLYAHTNNQFYRECDIIGTVDFIFGRAAAVFQKCNIQPRQPLPGQTNVIIAQGKSEPELCSGFSFHKSSFTPFDNVTAPTYLGRPWKNYSTTVVMQSYIDDFVNRLGWLEWTSGVEPPNTIFYGEYNNSGLGSSIDQRVNWTGYKSNLTDYEAAQFTVEGLIDGKEWLPETDVPFDEYL